MADGLYDAYGSLTEKGLQQLRERIKKYILNFKNNPENEEIQAIQGIITQLKSLVDDDVLDTVKEVSYYKYLQNFVEGDGLYRIQKSQGVFTQIHDLILQLRDILMSGKSHYQVALYKVLPDKGVKRFTPETPIKDSGEQKYARINFDDIIKEIQNWRDWNEAERQFNIHFSAAEQTIQNAATEHNEWHGYNKGHVAEAFEGHFQHDHRGKLPKQYRDLTFSQPKDRVDLYMHFWYAYKNKDIWFKGGDIKDLQVKFLDSRHKSIQSASLRSLQEIVTFVLRELGDINKLSKISDADADELAQKLIQVFFTTANIPADLVAQTENMFNTWEGIIK